MLVFLGGLDPEYVLERMEPYEIEACLDGIYLKNKESWEQTRQIVYTIAQVNSRRSINIKEMMPFPWEHTESTDIPDEERARLSSLMKEFIKNKEYGSRSVCEDSIPE